MINVKNSKDLHDALLRQENISLEQGDYELNFDKKMSVHISGLNPLATRIHLIAPLNVSYFSLLYRVGLVSDNLEVYVDLDKCSYAKFREVVFNSPTHKQREQEHKREAWDNLKQKAIAIRVNSHNNGDDTYGVCVEDCLFQTFDTGLFFDKPLIKGTVAWNLERNVFNGCRWGIYGTRVGELRMRGGIVQLAECGLYLDDSKSNWIEQVHFERSKVDIELTDTTCHNQLLWNDAPLDKIIDNGMFNRIREMRHRNIDRPCK